MRHDSLPSDPCPFPTLEAWARPRLLRYFLAGGVAHGDAQDLVQQTLLRLWRGLPHLRDWQKVIPWMFAIARRVRCSEGRRRCLERSRFVPEPLEEAVAEARPDPGAGGAELCLDARRRLSLLRRAIAALPSQQRLCLRLRAWEELSYEQIAATLRVSAHTVRNHLAQARRSLRQELEECAG